MSHVDYYNNMPQCMKYLCGLDYLPFILEADNTGVLKWCIIDDFSDHPDMKSHTFGLVFVGR